MNKLPIIEIIKGNIPTAVAISKEIPEFDGPPEVDVYQSRLAGVPNLILIAKVHGESAGFKVGYERDGYFYSWMGGIKPAFRKMGIAKALADEQENWAKKQGYTTITFKTRNHHKGMLIFALGNGFDIIGFKAHDQVGDHRILLRKSI